jgi:hypothetical protein
LFSPSKGSYMQREISIEQSKPHSDPKSQKAARAHLARTSRKRRRRALKKVRAEFPALDAIEFDVDAQAARAVAIPRADELTDEQLEQFATNYRLICLLENDVPAKEALKRLGIERTERWARKLWQRYREHGKRALLDGRTLRQNPATVLTNFFRQMIIMFWLARSAAGPVAIWEMVKAACQKKKGLTPPSKSAVQQYLVSLPEPLKLFRQGKPGIKKWQRGFCPVVRFNFAKYSNQRWQVDHTQLDIWVRVKVGGRWVPHRVNLSLYLDERSRSIPGFILSTKHPDGWTSSILMMKAAMPKENPAWKNKGLPEIVQPDRGRDLLANSVVTSFAFLGIYLDPDAPYYPNRKGKIERFFLSLDRACIRTLPGHMDAIGRTREAAEKHVEMLLTVPQLRKEIEHWIVEKYHQRVHSETGRKPAELWEETLRLRMPESEDALNLLLLKWDKTRTIKNTGIKFMHPASHGGQEVRYWAPELTYHVKTQCRLSYHPEDDESVRVYCAATGEFICEAWRMGDADSRYTIVDMKRNRSQFKHGLQERIKDYKAEIERQDRQNAEQANWEEARRLAESQAAEAQTLEPLNAADSESSEIVATTVLKFKQQDSGGDESQLAT